MILEIKFKYKNLIFFFFFFNFKKAITKHHLKFKDTFRCLNINLANSE